MNNFCELNRLLLAKDSSKQQECTQLMLDYDSGLSERQAISFFAITCLFQQKQSLTSVISDYESITSTPLNGWCLIWTLSSFYKFKVLIFPQKVEQVTTRLQAKSTQNAVSIPTTGFRDNIHLKQPQITHNVIPIRDSQIFTEKLYFYIS